MRVQDMHGHGLATCAAASSLMATEQAPAPALPPPQRPYKGPILKLPFQPFPPLTSAPSPRRRPIQAHLGHCPPTNTQKAVPSQQQGVHLWGWGSGAFRPAAALTSVPLQWPGELTLQMPGRTPGRIPARAHALGTLTCPPRDSDAGSRQVKTP